MFFCAFLFEHFSNQRNGYLPTERTESLVANLRLVVFFFSSYAFVSSNGRFFLVVSQKNGTFFRFTMLSMTLCNYCFFFFLYCYHAPSTSTRFACNRLSSPVSPDRAFRPPFSAIDTVFCSAPLPTLLRALRRFTRPRRYQFR